MNSELLFQSLLVILAVAGMVPLLLHRHARTSIWVGCILTFLAALLSILLSIEVILTGPISLGWSLNTFFGTWTLSLDQLGAFFLLIIGLVMASVSVYSIGYVRGYEGRYDVGLLCALLGLFFLSLVLVLSANNAVLFLISWEAMSLLSFLLVVFENKEERGSSAGYIYLTMTHLGTALIMVSLLFMAYNAGSYSFQDIADSTLPTGAASVLFPLLFLGFGTKAGMVPLHIWLPVAHPAAPSNISALMSGVMVKLALLMMLRCFIDLLGPAQSWWGLLILLVGSVSALIGVLHALKETDLKTTLAFSTVENMGILFIGLGAALVFQSYGLTTLAALALLATLFQALNHAVFKSLLFLGAGAVVHAAHTRNMEKLGGLAKPMPYTSAAVLVGLLSMAAIPPMGGFVSEWLLFQSLLQSVQIPEVLVRLIMPMALAILALTGALAVALAVRFFGITFLGKARTEAAAHAKESPRSMIWGTSFLAVLCIGFGLLSFWILPFLDKVTTSVLGVTLSPALAEGLVIGIGNTDMATIVPLAIGALMLAIAALAWALSRSYTGVKTTRSVDTWNCGTRLTPRNQYSGTGFSAPIIRVFGSLVRSRSEIRTEYTTSPYIKKRSSFEVRYPDIFRRYLYDPLSQTVVGLSKRVTIIQMGSIQAYLAYIFIILVLLLVVFR